MNFRVNFKKFTKRKVIPLTMALLMVSSSTSVFAGTNGNEGFPDNTDQYNNRYISVQILGVNDFHGQLNTTKKLGDRYAGGADYLAAYLKQREVENKNTLIVHAGDMVGASVPVSSLLQDEPSVEFMNMLGFDVGTPGNHEFDEGVDEMMRLLNGGYHDATGNFAGSNFPYVSANIVYKETRKPILPPYIVKKVNGMPIAFVGVTLTETPTIVMPSGVSTIEFTDEAEAIDKAVAELKDQKVEAIIVLAHAEGTLDNNTQKVTGKLLEIANSIDDEVDVIFAGHSHTSLNAIVDGKLIVESNSNGIAFSDVDLEIDPLTKDIVTKKAEIVTTYQDSIQPDAQVTQFVGQYEEKVAPDVNRIISTAKDTITRTQNGAGESALGNLIADAQRWKMGTDFAFTNPGGIRADIDQGEVTWGEAYAVQPFNNDLVKMTLKGEQIFALLNQQWSVNRMLQISGLEYSWKNNQVVDIFLSNGIKIDPCASYTVAVNSFLADGGDGFTILKEGTDREVGPGDLDGLIDYLEQLSQPFSASIEGRISKLN